MISPLARLLTFTLAGSLALFSSSLGKAEETAPSASGTPAAEPAMPEKILGYRVVQPTAEDLGTLAGDLSRFIQISAVKFGVFDPEVLHLEVYVQFLKDSPVLGKVDMIEFRKLSLNGVRFQIEGFKDIKIPKEGPYESDEPVKISARYADVDLLALKSFLVEDLQFHVEGQVWTFGKFKIGKKKGKLCIPVAVDVTVPAQNLAGNDKYDQVTSAIKTLVRTNIVGGLGDALKQAEGEPAPAPEATPAPAPTPAPQ